MRLQETLQSFRNHFKPKRRHQPAKKRNKRQLILELLESGPPRLINWAAFCKRSKVAGSIIAPLKVRHYLVKEIRKRGSVPLRFIYEGARNVGLANMEVQQPFYSPSQLRNRRIKLASAKLKELDHG
jgi:hypothetical protein